jgi:hypothetical protein
LQITWQFLWGLQDLAYHPADQIELDFRLAGGFVGADYVFGVVSKEEMVSIRDKRWDLVSICFCQGAGVIDSSAL